MHRPPCLPPGASTRSAATRGRASAGGTGRPRRPSRLPGEGGPHGRPRGPPIGGRLAGRPICCQQRWHRRKERAEALTRRTSGPSPMGSSPGRSSRPDTPHRPARFPRPASGAAARTRAPGRGGVNLCRPLVQPLTRAQNGRGAKERPLLCFQREYMFFSTTAPPAKSRSKCTKKGCRQGLCAN